MYPKTQPKQWNSGGGQQTMSWDVSRMRSPICLPLLRIERCERQAARGMAVVPDVNWMLTMSCGERLRGGKESPSALRSDVMEAYGVRLLYSEASTRPDELSMYMIFRKLGMSADSSLGMVRSWTICWRRGMLLRGSFRGRLDSALMIRWLASRCFSAATTCIELKDKLMGT